MSHDEESIATRLIEIAKWAPSGDNTQPWSFSIQSDTHLVMYGHVIQNKMYHVQGYPSHIAHGALLENLSIAASAEGYQIDIKRRQSLSQQPSVYDIYLCKRDDISPDPLNAFIKKRSVQRRALSTRPLTCHEKNLLEQSVGQGFSIKWLESTREKLNIASLLWANAKIRLTTPEAWQVHREVIAWRSKFSEDRIPDQAIGLDRLTLRLMEWVIARWNRVVFFNRFLGGTLLPRIELDLIPALSCGAHFVIVTQHAPREAEDFVATGRALQRFWLTATSLGLQLQPEMTPLIFSWNVREGISCSTTSAIWDKTVQLRNKLITILNDDTVTRAGFIGRIGAGKPANARSIRKPVTQLLL